MTYYLYQYDGHFTITEDVLNDALSSREISNEEAQALMTSENAKGESIGELMETLYETVETPE